MEQDKLVELLAVGDKFGADYSEIRYQNKYLANIQFRDGEMNNSLGSREGIGVRVLSNGSWGFASTNLLKKGIMEQTVKNAIKLAEGSAKTKKKLVKLADTKIIQERHISPRKQMITDVSIDEKIARILEASKVREDFPLVKSLSVNYTEFIDHRIIVTNEGSRVEREDIKPTIIAYAVAIEEGKMASGFQSWCHTMGAEFLDLHPFDEVVKTAANTAEKLVHAPLPPGGTHNLLLDPQLVGVLAHEAVGHTAEADLVLAGSFTQGKIGEKVCDDRITLVDAPDKDGSKWNGSGWLPVDDEGVKGRVANIITNGVMTDYMTNRELATELDIEPTGNARAYTFKDEPIVRMRNTYIEPGSMSFEELCEAVGEGYMLKSLQNGQADSSGEFMFGVVEAYKIINGEVSDELYQGPVLSGNAFEVLSSILGVGNKFDINLGAGFCGKEQPAKVDAGGPYLAVRANLAGGKQ